VGVLCFPALFEPKANSQNKQQAPRYSCILLFDELSTQSTAYQNLRAAVQEAAGEKWGAAKAADPAFMRSLRLPFRLASDKEYDGFEKGKVFIAPWSKGDGARPGVVDLHGKDIVVPADVFAGQLARATVRAFAYENQGNKGVAFGLEHVQIVKADEPRIDGRRSAESAFAGADNADMARFGVDPNAASSAGAAPAGGDMPW
jgi:hypothetical protein